MHADDEPCSCYVSVRDFLPPSEEASAPAIEQIGRRWRVLSKDPFLQMSMSILKSEETGPRLREKYLSLFNKHDTTLKKLRQKAPSSTSRTLRYLHFSYFEQLFEYLHDLNDFYYKWDTALREFAHEHKVRELYSTRFLPKEYKNDLKSYKSRRDKRREDWVKQRLFVTSTLQRLYESCIAKQHDNLRAIYEYGFMKFKQGDHKTATNSMQQLIRLSLQTGNPTYLRADTYIKLGIACSMSLEYAQAVEALTQAIEAHTAGERAYLERAIAHFEQGNFDAAISDYLASGKQNTFSAPDLPSTIDFAKGLSLGASHGLLIGLKEAPASIFYALQGAGQALWAGVKDPLGVPKQLVDALLPVIEYLQEEDLATIGQDMIPELRELLTNWNTLEWQSRGEKTGFILGKYGITVFGCYGSAKVAKRFQELRQANMLHSLQTMACCQATKAEVIASASAFGTARSQFFKNATISWDKQGKHIVGHRNYQDLLIQKKQPSIFSHPDPERLLKEYAGTGAAVGELEYGAGYKEIVNFKECIGEYYDLNTRVFSQTTRGKIHYDKNGGAHIVPAPPHFTE